MHSEVLDFAQAALANAQRVALVTLSQTGGHTPGKQGGLMAVDINGKAAGTVGGGAMENDLIRRCMAAIRSGQGFDFSYELTEKQGMLCGGNCSGFVHILGQLSKLVIFGAGHVGAALAVMAQTAGFDVIVVDERDRRVHFKDVLYIQELPENAQLTIEGDCYIVIVTHGHTQDYAALKCVINSPASYIGMIGSKNKVAAVYRQLLQEGIGVGAIEKVYSPIGLDIANGSPGEIAVAILAEILSVKNNKPAVNKRD